MSVAISWGNKMLQAKCDISVGFPKSSDINYAIVIQPTNIVNMIMSYLKYVQSLHRTAKCLIMQAFTFIIPNQ